MILLLLEVFDSVLGALVVRSEHLESVGGDLRFCPAS